MFTVSNYDDDIEDGDYDYHFDPELEPRVLEHPFLANRILTTPVVSTIRLDDYRLGFKSTVGNPNGITVHDVHATLAAA